MSESSRVPLHHSSAAPNTVSRRLPPYRGLVAVDAKDFTGYPAIEHSVISEAIPELLRISFEKAGIPEIWQERRFPDSTGDGYVFGFDPRMMPFVVHPWLAVLQDELTAFNVHSTGSLRIRLRVSLHVGPVTDSGAEFDGKGTARNDTHRLLDSRPVKAMLAASSENITQVAAILSARCYEDAVLSGYTGRHRDHFLEVPATVEGKNFAQQAWLYVPAPSGNLYDRRVLGDRVIADHEAPQREEQERPRAEEPSHGGTTVIHSDRGNVNSGTVHGGQSTHNVETRGGDHVGGNKAGTVQGNQGDQVQGDKNAGPR
ncbi:hypothetical protein SLNWT_3879 [Streptomyces albus]|uniref:Uncharacterized protein n=1 Tax=Streptomyces albus (strain ATCC 21838 / DSM 41398 / FERM P-419 / JCM 4703 / NBRC 107858) TaxID=1081613 RepID=A0A0B5EY86_STRA4|nr:hypothetical protein SLNWT_3879 [Streptomyces albus]AOU78562.1 hypothetical protein SLNHY_3871 [Streptomyces albus]AYN34306.1 hypothetical protein DUI70_3806 [Streptomyces albus]